MDYTEVLKRSLFRRAVLYAGNREGAERVVESVLRVQPQLPRMAEHQRDRLLIQRSREVASSGAAQESELAGVKLEGQAGQLWRLLRGLERQQREAWLLLEFEAYEEVPAARAMDCSRTAMNRFHEAANASLAELLDEEAKGKAITELGLALEKVDVEPSIDAITARLKGLMVRRRLMTTFKFSLLFGAMAIIAWVGYDLMTSESNRARLQGSQPQRSSELSPEEQRQQELIRQQELGEAAGHEIKKP